MTGNELWRETLKRSRERFGVFSDAIDSHFGPQPCVVVVRSDRQCAEDRERTLRCLRDLYCPSWGGMANGFDAKQRELARRMFSVPALHLQPDVRMPDISWSFYHSIHEGDPYVDRWLQFCRLARDAWAGISDSGLIDRGYFHRTMSGNETKWLQLLFLASWSNWRGSPLYSTRQTPSPHERLFLAWDEEQWQAARRFELDRRNDAVALNELKEDWRKATGEIPWWLETPPEWPDSLPTSWTSWLPDIANRSIDLINWALTAETPEEIWPDYAPDESCRRRIKTLAESLSGVASNLLGLLLQHHGRVAFEAWSQDEDLRAEWSQQLNYDESFKRTRKLINARFKESVPPIPAKVSVKDGSTIRLCTAELG